MPSPRGAVWLPLGVSYHLMEYDSYSYISVCFVVPLATPFPPPPLHAFLMCSHAINFNLAVYWLYNFSSLELKMSYLVHRLRRLLCTMQLLRCCWWWWRWWCGRSNIDAVPLPSSSSYSSPFRCHIAAGTRLLGDHIPGTKRAQLVWTGLVRHHILQWAWGSAINAALACHAFKNLFYLNTLRDSEFLEPLFSLDFPFSALLSFVSVEVNKVTLSFPSTGAAFHFNQEGATGFRSFFSSFSANYNFYCLWRVDTKSLCLKIK